MTNKIINSKFSWVLAIINVMLGYLFIQCAAYHHERMEAEMSIALYDELIVPFPYDYMKENTLTGNEFYYYSLVENPRQERNIGNFALYSLLMSNKYGDSIATENFRRQIAEFKLKMAECGESSVFLDSAYVLLNNQH